MLYGYKKKGWEMYLQASAVVFCAPVKPMPVSSRLSAAALGASVIRKSVEICAQNRRLFSDGLLAKGEFLDAHVLSQENDLEIPFHLP